jgi:hypothetical protein
LGRLTAAESRQQAAESRWQTADKKKTEKSKGADSSEWTHQLLVLVFSQEVLQLDAGLLRELLCNTRDNTWGGRGRGRDRDIGRPYANTMVTVGT